MRIDLTIGEVDNAIPVKLTMENRSCRPCVSYRIVETAVIRYLHAKMVFTTEAGCMPQDVIAASSTKQLKDEQSHLFLTKTI